MFQLYLRRKPGGLWNGNYKNLERTFASSINLFFFFFPDKKWHPVFQPDLDVSCVYGCMYVLECSLRKEGGCQELV